MGASSLLNLLENSNVNEVFVWNRVVTFPDCGLLFRFAGGLVTPPVGVLGVEK